MMRGSRPRVNGDKRIVSENHGDGKIKADYRRIAERRGRNIARVAAARRLLTLIYYGLRDGEIRCLAQPQEA